MNTGSLSFEEWCKQLDGIADADNAKRNDQWHLYEDHWKQLYLRGLTPQEAWNKTPWRRR
jgi:hypothetical protein